MLLPPLPQVGAFEPEAPTPVAEMDGVYLPSEEEKAYLKQVKGRHAKRGFQGTQNVRWVVKDRKLTLEVDLDKDYGIPEGKRNIRVASTLGIRQVPSPEHPHTYYMLNVYKFAPLQPRDDAPTGRKRWFKLRRKKGGK